MKALLWKDFHINRLVLAVGAGVLLAPYVSWWLIMFGTYWYAHTRDGWPWAEALATWARPLAGVALWSLSLSGLTVALLGGNAIAGERADRSAEFLACLPVSRRRIILSKVLLTLGTTAVIWVLNQIVIVSRTSSPQAALDFQGTLDVVVICACATCLAFGVAWFFSARRSSPAIAASAGIGAPIVLFMILALIAQFAEAPSPQMGRFLVQVYAVVSALVGIAGFVAGTICYVRRSEP